MSFLDRASKWVTDTVDKGKRELDQMSRINRIRGEIRDLGSQIDALEAQINGIKVRLGEKALEMLKAGTLSDPELQTFSEQVVEFEGEIATRREAIAEKEAAIEEIKAEEVAPPEAAPVPAAEGAPAPAAGAPQAGMFCPQCGAALSGGVAFCAQCGSKLS